MGESKKSTVFTRRKFLNSSAAAAASIPFLTLPFQNSMSTGQLKTNAPLKILILGGTSFLGPHQIEAAIKNGHKITTFTRGKTKPSFNKQYFEDVESLIGDREDNLEALKGRKWDVVIDNSGRQVHWTEKTAELLKDAADIYMYISSVSVYFPYTGDDFSEERKLVLEIPDGIDEEKKLDYDYGVMKAQSELATIKAFGKDRSIIVRPHFMVGPGDPTNRFTYWPVRLEKGGEVMVPDTGNNLVQYIDVRDIAAWMIHLLENKISGTFNGSGPGFEMDVKSFVHGAHAAFSSAVSFTYIDDYDFLEKEGAVFMCPWILPMKEYVGMPKSTTSKAIANGLKFRPLAETVKDTINWWHSEDVSEEKRTAFLEGEKSVFKKEIEVLKSWKERG